MSTRTTLVIGGTGKTGRRVATRLQARGLPVRIGSRSSATPFDWERPDTWAPALRDVSAVYLTYYPDLAAPGASAAIEGFTRLAKSAGAPQVVLLSGRGEDEAQKCERIVQDSGLPFTIVRASWFNQNFSENYLLEPLQAGEVALPIGDVGEPFIDADDIADVATAALTDRRHLGQLYEVTGPRLLTFRQAVAEIARASGRDIRYVQVSRDDYAAGLRAAVPSDVASLIMYLFEEVLDGRNESTTDGVMRALGRPARDFADYARATAATGIWSQSAAQPAAPA
jgi:uncharacterized protein YbjT (DUF2867 family)